MTLPEDSLSDYQYFIELPQDGSNRPVLSPILCVVKGHRIGDRINIISPAFMENRYPQVQAEFGGGWVRTDGPERILTVIEYDRLVKEILDERERPHDSLPR